MNLTSYIQSIQAHLISTHARVINWFAESEPVKNYRPLDNGWTILEVLEHISLTSFFLLKLIDKGADKALRNVHNKSLEKELGEFDFDLEKLQAIGVHKSFPWVRPAHMEPTGAKSELEIINTLKAQLEKCLSHLNKLKNGEGLLYQTTMSVNDLGKLNVYEYIYFLSNHAERHIGQMEENKTQYLFGLKNNK